MAERRAIDAVELAKEVSSLRVSVTGLRAGKGVLSAYAKKFKKSVLKIIDEAETLPFEDEAAHGPMILSGKPSNLNDFLVMRKEDGGNALIECKSVIEKIVRAQDSLKTDDDALWEINSKYFKGLAWALRILLDEPAVDTATLNPGGWIPTSERAPTEADADENGLVMVRLCYGTVDVSVFKYVHKGDCFYKHWMKIPEL